MPFVVVEVVMEDELEVIGCVEWEWEIYDVVVWVFYSGWIDVKCIVGAWLINFVGGKIIPEGVGWNGEGEVVEVDV